MFDSGIKAADLIREVKSEVGVAPEIPDGTYLTWLNALEQLLYSEIILEQNKIVTGGPQSDVIVLSDIFTLPEEESLEFEAIHAIYAYFGGEFQTQLIKSTVASGAIFKDTFFKIGQNIGINLSRTAETITVVYIVRPKIKTAEQNVFVPYEWIELVKTKLRGEAYKLRNENQISEKWLNNYSELLENFKAWINERKGNFGI